MNLIKLGKIMVLAAQTGPVDVPTDYEPPNLNPKLRISAFNEEEIIEKKRKEIKYMEEKQRKGLTDKDWSVSVKASTTSPRVRVKYRFDF